VAGPRQLDLGAGPDRDLPGAVTLDRAAATSPHIVHDLETFPWPIDSNSFDAIRAKDVLEHLSDLTRVMAEIHRVGAPGARVEIFMPHYSCRNSWTDPTHKQHLGYFSFDHFLEHGLFHALTGCGFRLVGRRLRGRPTLKGRLVEQVANRWPAFYEEHLAWIAPAFFLHVVLEVRKDT
jgi:SAM-dependent methyltransferase